MLSLFRFVVPMLSILATSAWAQTPAAPGAPASPVQGMLVSLPIWLALFAMFYFGIIRPQRAQQKKQQDFLSTLARGDEVVTASGLIGTIRGLTDRVVTLEIAPNTEVKMMRGQVQAKLKETLAQGGAN